MALLRCVVFFLTLAALAYDFQAHTIGKRAESDDEPKPPPEICIGGTPCGWAVYNKTTRVINDFWKNRCVCNSTTTCVKDYDQLATTTYIYRCRPLSVPQD